MPQKKLSCPIKFIFSEQNSQEMVLVKKTSTKKKKKRDDGTQPMVHTAGGINKTFPRVLKNSFGGKMTHQLWFVFPFLESFDIFLLEFQLSQKMTQRIRSALTKKCGIHQRCHPFKPALVTTTLSCIL